MRQYIAGPNEDGMRLSRFVQRVTWRMPDSALYKAFRNKRIKVNGKHAQPQARLAAGDEVLLYINDDFFSGEKAPAPSPKSHLQAPPLDIVYEDEGIAVLFKPAGLLSHRDAKGKPSLLDGYTAHLEQAGLYNPDREHTFTPALCNRLDQGTEGLVVAARTAPALRGMNLLIREGLLHKYYLCITSGAPPEGVHHAFLRRDTTAKNVQVTADALPGSKPISTCVTIIQRHGGLALCEVELHTGRTHQIRAHLAYLGAPLLGDAKYGGATRESGGLRLNSQALCAYKLHFDHNIPKSSALHHLAGSSFTAQAAQLPALWQAHCGGQPL